MLDIEVRGQQQISAKISGVADLDTRDLLDQSAALLFNRIITRFQQQTAPDGTRWEPSKAALKRQAGGYTRASDGKYYTGGYTLFQSGRLYHSLQVYAVGEDSRGIGTDVEYAAFAQYGKPNRIYLGFSDMDAEIVQKFILGRIKKALGG
jgi:phage gpG-like protein